MLQNRLKRGGGGRSEPDFQKSFISAQGDGRNLLYLEQYGGERIPVICLPQLPTGLGGDGRRHAFLISLFSLPAHKKGTGCRLYRGSSLEPLDLGEVERKGSAILDLMGGGGLYLLC
ncbi:hypothetical protein AAFF_G00030240 [Aldrovandia affinis]|uniref:Uncharacterized protein n=1 Tax=Aldrovandia affinis TaxID=143900 RepID=A0AAD7S428_9TELE|nr:hypothetical protein AAFF_G00030240 [Aldrovandia affinis]